MTEPCSDILRAVLAEFDGRPLALARAIGAPVLRQHVEGWIKQGAIPPTQCPRIEAVTQGRFTCEQMTDKVVWARIPDPTWLWHPAGRPVIDVAAPVIVEAA